MITRLHIKGLAIIDSLEIEFTSGFNVITGETGAGKSVLILALHFLTGAKVSSEVIRSGESQATVSGEFLVPDKHPAVLTLCNLGVPVEILSKEAVICIRRQINDKGRAQAWINDTLVASTHLKEVGGMLVDVFAQHENQRLMNPAEHIRYLDEFAADDAELKLVDGLYKACIADVSAVGEILKLIKNSHRDKDYLLFRSDELKRFDPSQSEFERISLLSESSDQLVKDREVYQRALNLLESEEGSVSSRLWETTKILPHLGERGSSLNLRLEAAAREVDDISYLLNQESAAFDIDEKSLEQAQARQFAYQDLFRKHSVKDAAGLMLAMEKLEAEVKILESAKEMISERLSSLESSLAELKLACARLSKIRRHAFINLKQAVQKEMRELSMAGASLDVEWLGLEKKVLELE